MAVDLKEYLKSAYELEAVLEASMLLEREYSNTLVTLGRPMKLVEPCEPEKADASQVKNGLIMLLLSLIFLAVGLSIMFIIGLALSVWKIATAIPNSFSQKSLYRNALSKYGDEVALYQIAKEKEEHRLDGERAIAASLRTKRDELTTANEQLRNSLAKLYDMDILHYSFRNKKAVERLYYYIDTRICDQLEGDKGAYLRYQDDLRTEAIIGAIDNFRRSVEQRLDTIIRNQRAALAELRAANIAIQSMKEALEETNNRLYQVDQKLSSLERQQITANDYLSHVSSTLDSVVNAQEIDRMNTYAIAMNQYHSLVQHNAEDMYLVRPYH